MCLSMQWAAGIVGGREARGMCLAQPMATASRQAHATAEDLPSRAACDAGRRGRPPPLLPGAVQRLCQGAYQPPHAVICKVSRASSGQCAGAQESLHKIAPPVHEGEQICTRSRLPCPRSSCVTCTPIGGRPMTSPSARSTCTTPPQGVAAAGARQAQAIGALGHHARPELHLRAPQPAHHAV
jgi:hypothetical protein